MRLRLWFVVLGALLLLGLAWAQPQIRSITLEGCKVTKPEAVLEAANISEGMEFNEPKIRQALLELGLFDSVTVQYESLPNNTVAVTITVKEKSLPTPTTSMAAKALNLPAAALRCFENEASNLNLNLRGGFAFSSVLTADLPEWRPNKKASWAQKFVQWQSSRDGKLKERLTKELDNYLRRNPSDVEARLARAVLLTETDKIEQFKEALSEIQRLLSQHPNLHWAYTLRLSVLTSHAFSLSLFLPAKLPQSGQISVTATGEFPKLTLEPSKAKWLRGEFSLAISEGERYFRRLPDKRWDKEAVKAAVKFFSDATNANFLMAMTKTVEEMAEEYGKEFLPPERLIEPVTRYFNDFMRISQIARHFANDAEVQWAMAVWGLQQVVAGLLATSLPAIISESDNSDDDNDNQISQFGVAFFAQRNLYRPALERLGWHLQRVIALDKKRASKAFALLAIQRAFMGDFNAAYLAVEKGLQQPQPDEQMLVTAISGLAWTEVIFATVNRPSEEHEAIISALRHRYSDWVGWLHRSHPFMPYLAFARAVFRLAENYSPQAQGEELNWKSFPEFARQEALKILQEAARRNPRSNFAQRVCGLALLLEGEVERALPHLRKAYELNPVWFPSRYALALGYLMAGDTEKALLLFRSKL